jgi:hypothetical protein
LICAFLPSWFEVTNGSSLLIIAYVSPRMRKNNKLLKFVNGYLVFLKFLCTCHNLIGSKKKHGCILFWCSQYFWLNNSWQKDHINYEELVHLDLIFRLWHLILILCSSTQIWPYCKGRASGSIPCRLCFVQGEVLCSTIF